MAGMKFEYDENGGKFYYFLLSFYALIVIPCTYYLWPKNEKKRESTHPEDISSYVPCRIKYQLLNSNEPFQRKKQALTKVILVIAWIIFVVLAYRVSKIEIEHKEYDPYIVLGVDRGATDKEVRKQYRELSKTMHPDKGGDPEQFKELIKAYKSLTDEETKKNWEEYGNPDGPGATHFGIALPKWMVDDKNSIFVLGIYVLVFMVFMPTVVGIWWYRSIKYTSDKIFIITAQMYWTFLIRTTIIIPKRAIMILAASFEFDRNHNPEVIERPSDNIEIPQLMKNLQNLQEKNREIPLCCPYSVKARALIHAHLSRIDLPPNTLLKDKYTVIKKCPYLINEMASLIAQIVGYTHAKGVPQPRLDTIENVMKMSPMIVQAIWDGKHSLLQLPHIDEGHLRHFVTKRRHIGTIKQFVAAKDSERRSILRHLTDEQYDDIMRVCETYPHVEMRIKSEVFDDEDQHTITAGAIVTLTVTLKRQNLKTLFDNESYEDKQHENQSNENGDVDESENQEKVTEETKQKPALKPWEKQKKKPKHLKQKPKSKQQQQQKPIKTATPKKSESNDLNSGKIEDLISVEKNEANTSDHDDENGYDDEDDDTENENNQNEKLNTTKLNEKSKTDEDFFVKFQQQQKKREVLEPKKRISHRVFCPYFPIIKQECWWLYVADRKQRQLISAPVYICTLKDQEEVEIKFSAPQKVGIYVYSVVLRSDSYMDFDISENIKLDVKPAVEIEDHPQWNIEDDNEKAGSNVQEDDEYATEDDE